MRELLYLHEVLSVVVYLPIIDLLYFHIESSEKTVVRYLIVFIINGERSVKEKFNHAFLEKVTHCPLIFSYHVVFI